MKQIQRKVLLVGVIGKFEPEISGKRRFDKKTGFHCVAYLNSGLFGSITTEIVGHVFSWPR